VTDDEHRALLESLKAIAAELSAAYGREDELTLRLRQIEAMLFGSGEPARNPGPQEAVDAETPSCQSHEDAFSLTGRE
jgi:hypothetical protein